MARISRHPAMRGEEPCAASRFAHAHHKHAERVRIVHETNQRYSGPGSSVVFRYSIPDGRVLAVFYTAKDRLRPKCTESLTSVRNQLHETVLVVRSFPGDLRPVPRLAAI